MDSTKKLRPWGRGVSKIQKNCRRRLWMVPNWISKASAPCRSLDHDIRDVYYRASAGFVQWISRSLILFKPKNAGNNVGTLCTPQFYRPTASIDVSTLEPDLLAWGPFKMLFPPLVGVCSGVHFHFECTFMTLTPFPLAGFFKISLAVCYFSNGFGPWPSHYLQGVYKRTNYRLQHAHHSKVNKS